MKVLKSSAERSAPPGAQTLARGLEILRLLAEGRGPLTATELAARTGTHQSSASRLLRALNSAGYVRKVGNRGFTVDSGVFELAANAAQAFSLTEESKLRLREISAWVPDQSVILGALWKNTFVHLYEVKHGQEPIPFSVSTYPLHLSTAALLALLARPIGQAVQTLAHSRERFGWERPTPNVPQTEIEVLAAVHERCADGVLTLENWSMTTRRTGAILVDGALWGTGALSFTGESGTLPQEQFESLLKRGARAIEETFTA